MNNQTPESKSNLDKFKYVMDLLDQIARPAVFIFGIVDVIYSLIQSFRGDNRITTWIFAGVGFVAILVVLLILVYARETYETKIHPRQLLKRPRFPKYVRAARIGIWVLVALVFVSGGVFYYNYYVQEERFVVVIANFSSDEQSTDSVTGKIILQMRAMFPEDQNDTRIITPGIFISEQQGPDGAKKLADSYQADLIIWGWYETTDTNTLLTVHIENLTESDDVPLSSSEVREYKPSVQEFDSFSFHDQFSGEMTSIALLVKSLYFYQIKDYQNAINIISQAISIGTKKGEFISPDALLVYRGTYSLFSQDMDAALSDFEEAIKISPDYSNAYNGRGAVYLSQGNIDAAIEEFSFAANKEPNYPKAFFNRGVAHAILGEYDLAITDFSTAIEIDAEYGDAYIQRAGVYLYLEVPDITSAINDIEMSFRLNNFDSDAYNVRGNIKKLENDYEGAIEDYSKALEIAPNTLEYLYNRGNVYAFIGNYQLAIQDFSAALKTNPDHVSSYYSRGFTYFQISGEKEGVNKCDDLLSAVFDFDKAIRLQPSATLFFHRAQIYHLMGDENLAIWNSIDDGDGYGSNSGGDGDGYGSNSWGDDGGAWKCGNAINRNITYQLAIKDYSAAIELAPDDYQSYYNRALIYIELNEPDKAIEDLLFVIENSQRSELVSVARKTLESLGSAVP